MCVITARLLWLKKPKILGGSYLTRLIASTVFWWEKGSHLEHDFFENSLPSCPIWMLVIAFNSKDLPDGNVETGSAQLQESLLPMLASPVDHRLDRSVSFER